MNANTHTRPIRLTAPAHTHAHEHNEGASQLATQPVTRMLFSTTGGSTLPSQPTHTPPLHYFYHSISPSSFTLCYSSRPLYLVSLFPAEACCFQVQVAGCNLSNMSPSPFGTQVSPEPAPMFTFPISIFGQLKVLVLCVSVLQKCICVCCPNSSTCV